jgi:DsbC/DsbD-like thiol-disulfide interchange protein
VYEGSPTVVATIARIDLPENATVRGTVTTQACDDQVCLPPSRLRVTAVPVE